MNCCADLPVAFGTELHTLYILLCKKKHFPSKQSYPFELLLAPLPKKYRGMVHKHFPGDVSGHGHLFLYPTGWFLNFIVSFSVLPSIPLFFISFWFGAAYFVVYFFIYRFLFLYLRKPVLNILWHKWLPVYDAYVEDIPQLTIFQSEVKSFLLNSGLKDFCHRVNSFMDRQSLTASEHKGNSKAINPIKSIWVCLAGYLPSIQTWPVRKQVWYRQPVNWSNRSQQECFLAMAIFDRLNLKGNARQSTLWSWENVKVVLFVYFPVWCSYFMLVLSFCALHFTGLYKKLEWFADGISFRMFMISGLIWAILALGFSMKMKRFMETFEQRHNADDLISLIRKWLPIRICNEPELIEMIHFNPQNHLIVLKIVNFVQIGIITVYMLLIRIAYAINKI